VIQIANSIVIAGVPRLSPKGSIDALVGLIQQCEQTPMPVTHRFTPGVYAREITIPAGTVIVGHVHRNKCLNMALTGRAILDVNGDSKEVCAPHVFESDAGSQKAALVVEDMRWITIHANPDNITDIPTIEDMIFHLPEEIRTSGIPLDDFRMQRNQLTEVSQ